MNASPRDRPWRGLISAVLAMILILLALALWSEREDSLRVPQPELETSVAPS